MKEQVEDQWTEYEKDPMSGDFWKPEENRQYHVVIGSVEVRKEAFKEGDEPKWRATIRFNSVDGKPEARVWQTASRTILDELKRCERAGKLGKTKHLLRKKKQGETVTYVFEDLGGIQPLTSEGADA